MKKTIPHALIFAAAGGLFLLTLAIVVLRPLPAAEKTAAPASPSRLAQDLTGVWVHVGSLEKVGPPPASGGRLKFRTGRHWTLVGIEPRASLVDESFGGTYTVNGDVYAETVDYGTEDDGPYIGKTYSFRVTVEGDTMTQIGLNNPWHEVWKRVK